jgi:hypothetical protein
MTEKESEEFTWFRVKEVPGGLERWERIKKLENLHNTDKFTTSPTLQQLYPQAKYCYIHECYLASIAVASFGIEAHLKINLYGISPPEWTGFKKLIEEAKDNNSIGDDLAERLQRLRETIRNYIVHPDSMFGIRFLGLKKKTKDKPYWGEPGGPPMKTDKEAAEEAIECLLVLNKEYPFKISVPEDGGRGGPTD